MLNAFRNSTLAMVTAAMVIVLLGILAVPTMADEGEDEMEIPIVVMETSMGTMKIALFPDKAPITVENFLWYVDNGFYDGLIFHRVIPGFMVQGGGMTKDMVRKQGRPPIKLESDNGLLNDNYTIAMARTGDPNSATAQFFINVKDNKNLNYSGSSNPGYAVFGKVIEGQDVVDLIKVTPTTKKGAYNDVPMTAITIDAAYRIEHAPESDEAEGEDSEKETEG